MLSEASYYLRMAIGFAQMQLAPRDKDPVGVVLDQLRHREERFLQLARFVLERPDHLYRQMFDAAGCSYADLEAGIRKDGLRETLTRLLHAGVYVTHDEFRGRTPIVRSGKHIAWHAKDWNNPWGGGFIEQSTSGTSGRRFTTTMSDKAYSHRDGYEMLEIRELKLGGRPYIIIGAILPSAWPIRRQLAWLRMGIPVERWFAVGAQGTLAYRTMTNYLVAQSRLLGAPVRFPEYLPHNDFTPVSKALAELRSAGRPGYVRSVVSAATRTAVAARENNLDIRDTIFSVSGEPLTQRKREIIEATGARVYPQFQSSDFGVVGYSCASMSTGNCVHLFDDALMIVPRRAENAEHDSLFLTNLLLRNPRILINLEMDDSAVIEKVTCDCEYTRAGFTMQARDIFSYGKVTGQGMTMQASDLVEILETVLPEHFGGSPGDYQLAEVEGAGQTEMVLRISPRTGVRDSEAVRAFLLNKIGELHGGSLSQRVWQFSGGFRAVLEEPETTFTGKAHSLRLRGAGTNPAAT